MLRLASITVARPAVSELAPAGRGADSRLAIRARSPVTLKGECVKRISYLAVLAILCSASVDASDGSCAPHLDQNIRKLRSEDAINLCSAFAGRPLLVVNTASHCGFTRQFSGLEALHQAYKDRGLAVVGVPSNDFRQAAADEQSAARVCFVNYGVTFTMLAQQHVTGPEAHPLFEELGRSAGAPRWNFTQYLLDRDGAVVKRFDSGVEPMSKALREAVEALL